MSPGLPSSIHCVWISSAISAGVASILPGSSETFGHRRRDQPPRGAGVAPRHGVEAGFRRFRQAGLDQLLVDRLPLRGIHRGHHEGGDGVDPLRQRDLLVVEALDCGGRRAADQRLDVLVEDAQLLLRGDRCGNRLPVGFGPLVRRRPRGGNPFRLRRS